MRYKKHIEDLLDSSDHAGYEGIATPHMDDQVLYNEAP